MEKVLFGLDKLAYAKIDRASNGTVTYGTPVMIPGAKSLSLPPVGENVKVYADNIVFYNINVNQGYEGDFTVLTLPESFYTEMFGEQKIGDTNLLVENANSVLGEFAFLFQLQTDIAGKTKRGVLYNCTAARPEIGSETKEETVTPYETVVTITASPATDTQDIKATIVGDATDALWNAWFTKVVTRVDAETP